MANVVAYHRPSSLDEALQLLSRSTVRSRVLAGGTDVVGHDVRGGDAPFEAVDLQNAGLGSIDVGESRAVLGAMVTLEQISHHHDLPEAIRDAARRELPSTLRTLATLGGTICAAEAESEFLATLLIHDPVVEVHGTDGRRELPMSQVWAESHHLDGRIITAVSLAIDGVTRADRTARTPADRPIVAAVARRGDDGRVRLALSGVAPTPVLTSDAAGTRPPGDFRGSSEYRRHLAITLAERVTGALA
jgi:CO/xanthine dehydrogenase FAD-binding subunit